VAVPVRLEVRFDYNQNSIKLKTASKYRMRRSMKNISEAEIPPIQGGHSTPSTFLKIPSDTRDFETSKVPSNGGGIYTTT